MFKKKKKKKEEKKLSPSYIILGIQRLGVKQSSSGPHQDLSCLQIQLFSSLVLKEIIYQRKYKGYFVCIQDKWVF